MSARGDVRHPWLALALILPGPSIGAALAVWIIPGAFGSACYAAGKAVLYGGPALWRRFVDRAPWSLSPMRRGGLALGLASGLVIAAVVQLAWRLVGGDALDLSGLHEVARVNGLDTPARYLVAATTLSLVNAALEEYAFRWFVFTRLDAVMGTLAATLLAALAFTAHHVIVLRAYFDWPLTLTASAGVFTGGVAWSWLYARTGSIWPGWASHVLVDASIFWIGWRVLFGT